MTGILSGATPLMVDVRQTEGAPLHVAARLTRAARRIWLHLPDHWPWANQIHTAYKRLAIIAT
jgi:hypothetical protein